MSNELFRKYTDEETFMRIVEMDSVSMMWRRCLAEFADATAIEDAGVKYSYSEIEDLSAKLRTAILNVVKDVKAPATIGILATNSINFVKAFLAVTTLGYTAVVLPPALDEKTIYGCTMKFGMAALIYEDVLAEKTSVIKSVNPGFGLISTSATADTPTSMVDVSPETPCCIMFTGGTTGKSKGALLSNRAIMQGTVNGCYGYKEVFGQRYLLVLPFFHVFGLVRNLLTSLYTGSDLYICKNNKDMFKDVAMFRPTILVMVPALAEMALNLSKKFGKNMLGDDLQCIICGAAPVAPYLISEYQKIGVTLLPGYGLTESANLVSGNPEALSKPASVGIPYDHQELKIVNGELWIKGPNMMDGYVGEEENPYEDGYFKTGDLARLDEDGFLYITGRIKEIIVLPSGENISPAEIEAKVNELSFVQDSQVFEYVLKSGQHVLALEIVPRMTEVMKLGLEDSNAYMMSELNKLNDTLPSYQKVNKIIIRDSDFERTPSMKIKRYSEPVADTAEV